MCCDRKTKGPAEAVLLQDDTQPMEDLLVREYSMHETV
jgi:hypothetical protein